MSARTDLRGKGEAGNPSSDSSTADCIRQRPVVGKQREMIKQDDNVEEIIFSCTTELMQVSQGSIIHNGS